MRILWLMLFVLPSLVGCATISDQYDGSASRHPCGNIWDICPGDSAILDRINHILQGK